MTETAQEKASRIGKKIRETMNQFGISVKELSAKTGIELQTLYSILNGHHQASVEKLEAISRALHLSIDALLDLEVNTFPIYAEPHEAPFSYAQFEDIWFGPSGGERISVSRNFSVMNHSLQLRKEFLEKIYGLGKKELKVALEAFEKRMDVIKKKEKRRLEFVVDSEVVDFIKQREPFDKLSKKLVRETIEKIIERLENDPLNFEVVIIPRQYFLVNYEIINREVILFDLGSVFFRQTHPALVNHFINEVEQLKFKKSKISERSDVIKFLRKLLNGKG
jgi:transcriptional regulator with XRE-family HTH domain